MSSVPDLSPALHRCLCQLLDSLNASLCSLDVLRTDMYQWPFDKAVVGLVGSDFLLLLIARCEFGISEPISYSPPKQILKSLQPLGH